MQEPELILGEDLSSAVRAIDTLAREAVDTAPVVAETAVDTVAVEAILLVREVPVLTLGDLQNDWVITAVLLMCFFGIMIVLARSQRAITLQLRNFFRDHDRNKLFELRSQSAMRHSMVTMSLGCLLGGLLFGCYEVGQSLPFEARYVAVGGGAVVGLFYCVVKRCLYSVVNWTFFSPDQCARWRESYTLVALGAVLVLFLLTLGALFGEVAWEWLLVAGGAVALVLAGALIFKSVQIFFVSKLGVCQMIVYFCALEIAPLLSMWSVLRQLSRFLVEFYSI